MILQVYSLLFFTKWSDFVYRLGMDQDLSFHIWKGMNILKFQRFWREHLRCFGFWPTEPGPDQRQKTRTGAPRCWLENWQSQTPSNPRSCTGVMQMIRCGRKGGRWMVGSEKGSENGGFPPWKGHFKRGNDGKMTINRWILGFSHIFPEVFRQALWGATPNGWVFCNELSCEWWVVVVFSGKWQPGPVT